MDEIFFLNKTQQLLQINELKEVTEYATEFPHVE